jgi:hypothetical protein
LGVTPILLPEVNPMSVTIRAHYDGKVLVLDEPVDLPVNEPLELEWHAGGQEPPVSHATRVKQMLEALRSRPLHGLSIPAEALRRENMYEERL